MRMAWEEQIRHIICVDLKVKQLPYDIDITITLNCWQCTVTRDVSGIYIAEGCHPRIEDGSYTYTIMIIWRSNLLSIYFT